MTTDHSALVWGFWVMMVVVTSRDGVSLDDMTGSFSQTTVTRDEKFLEACTANEKDDHQTRLPPFRSGGKGKSGDGSKKGEMHA